MRRLRSGLLALCALASVGTSAQAQAQTLPPLGGNATSHRPPPRTVRGVVRGADAAGTLVQFVLRAGGGAPGCIVSAREHGVLATTCDAAGKFEMHVPEGACGTVLARRGERTSLPAPAVAGDVLVLELVAAPPPRTRVRLRGAREGATCQVYYEGDGELPPHEEPLEADGSVLVPRLPGWEAWLVLPSGTCDERGEVVVPVPDEDMELTVRSAPLDARGDAWTQPFQAGPPFRAAWGGDGALWVGQDARGRAFFGNAPGAWTTATGAGEVTARLPAGAGAAVLVQSSPLEHGDRWAPLVVAHRREGAGERVVSWPGLPEQQPWLLLVQLHDSGDWVAAGGGAGAARDTRVAMPAGAVVVQGYVHDHDGVPLAHVHVHVRPAVCRGAAAGAVLPGVVTRTDGGGRFALPCRLVAGAWDLLVRTADARVELRTIELAGDQAQVTVPIRMPVPQVPPLEGSIESAGGGPAGGVLVSVLSGREPPWLAGFGGLPAARADRLGRFRLGGLVAGVPYEVFCDTATQGRVLADNVRAGGDPLRLRLSR